MHLESRCYSSSAINKQTDKSEENIEHATATASININRSWLRNHNKRDKSVSGGGTGIFSFFQKFRVVNNKNEANSVTNSRYSLGSPQSSRYSLASAGVGSGGAGAGRRWESIESVISSATATSFAFIPPHQLRQFNYPRPATKIISVSEKEQLRTEGRVSNGADNGYRSSQNRYRLVTDENRTTAIPATDDTKEIANVKRLNRNSTGNIENFWVSATSDKVAVGSSVLHSDKRTTNITQKRKRCHRPGKRKAPQPPGFSNRINTTNVNGNHSKLVNGIRRRSISIHYEDNNVEDENYRNDENRDINVIANKTTISSLYRKKKKRQAPLPPKIMNDQRNNTDNVDEVDNPDTKPQTQHQSTTNDDLPEADQQNDKMPITYCNDSLKLEKGILKANKRSVEVVTKNDTVKLTSPITTQTAAVSPKPWYKRSCVKVNTHNNLSSFREKRNSCRKDEMDQWMLESGIARFKRTDDDIFKRHSHISVLANISELDRQASEILEKQRKQQRDEINSAEAKFYSDLLAHDQSAYKERMVSNENSTSNSKKNKDLISILNNLTTSVTKMSVHSAFVSSRSVSHDTYNNEKNTLASESSSSSVNKISERSRQESTQSVGNLLGNKYKKTSKFGEIFDKNHRGIKKKDERKIMLNKSSTSFETITDTKAWSKEKPTVSTAFGSFIPMKSNSEPDNTNISREELLPVQKTPQQIARPVEKPFSSWSCPQCNSENPSWKFICEKCKKWRPYSVSSRTTDQRYFINLEKDIAKKPNSNNVERKHEQTLQMDLNVNNAALEQTNDGFNLKSEKIKSNSKFSSSQRNTQRQEFYSSIAASVTLDKVEDLRKNSISSQIINPSSLKNNLNGTQHGKPQITNHTVQYYSDQDRKMLCDILKELKNSLSSSQRGKVAINVENEPIEHKIINTVDSVPSKQSSNSVENTATASSISRNGEATSTRTFTDANDFIEVEVTQKHDPSATGSKELQQAKHELNDEIDGGEKLHLPQNERRQFNEIQLTGASENKSVPVLAINRLLKKLQTAIANGQHHEAANIARELARLKVSCHMTRRSPFGRPGSSNSKTDSIQTSTNNSRDTFIISVYIKEQNLCRGPIPLQIHHTTTLEQLKTKLSNEFKIPTQRQQWRTETAILNDETAVLHDLGIDKPGNPLYVHLTENEIVTETSENVDPSYPNGTTSNVQNNVQTTQNNHEVKVEQKLEVPGSQSPTPDNLDYNAEHQNDIIAENEINEDNDEGNAFNVDDTHGIIPTTKVDFDDGHQASSTRIVDKSVPDDNITAALLPTPGWPCTVCTLINEIHIKFCAACGEKNVNADIVENKLDNDLPSSSKQYHNYAPWRTTKKELEENQNDHLEDENDKKNLYYQELIDLEKNDLILNKDSFECSVCWLECDENEGIVLRDCLHTFCKDCLQQTIRFSTEAQVKCPFGNASYSCDSVLQEREIKALVDADEYEKHLARSLSEAQNKIKNAFHCKTVNCTGWCIYEDNVNEFHCPVCRKTNCLTCQVIHGGLNCKQYQEMTKKESENNVDTSKTRNMLEEMVEKGEAMVCPTCDIILMKKWGCDWLRCSMCKTEICWVTRGPRWGPAGKGDTSAGCRCGVNGVKCHPRCNYCH